VYRHKRFRWLPFYLLLPLAGALIFLDEDLPIGDTVRMMFLGAIVLLICILAVRWIDRHPRLFEYERMGSLRTHFLPPGTTPRWARTEDGCTLEDDDLQFTPIRHSRSGE
jgi:hypothetical protein